MRLPIPPPGQDKSHDKGNSLEYQDVLVEIEFIQKTEITNKSSKIRHILKKIMNLFFLMLFSKKKTAIIVSA